MLFSFHFVLLWEKKKKKNHNYFYSNTVLFKYSMSWLSLYFWLFNIGRIITSYICLEVRSTCRSVIYIYILFQYTHMHTYIKERERQESSNHTDFAFFFYAYCSNSLIFFFSLYTYTHTLSLFFCIGLTCQCIGTVSNGSYISLSAYIV